MDDQTDLQFEITPAAPDELHIAATLRAAMTEEFGKDWDSDNPRWRERFVEYFTMKQGAGQGQVLFARCNGEVIGITAVSLVDDYHGYVRGKKSGRINAVYVKPAHRRHGIASDLLRSAMDWLRKKGCVRVRLNATEEAEALYKSLGFTPLREMECAL